MGNLDSRPDIPAGVRVVRGPDWKWGSQDGGQGYVGTVVTVGSVESIIQPENTVEVVWDNGTKNTYRVGHEETHDLRLLDNAQSGVRHPTVTCDVCNQHGIYGIRWKCSDCDDFDLCSPCYYSGKHDQNHSFIRFIAPNFKGVKMTKRSGQTTIMAKGIFTGAVVTRGTSWQWGLQDGGEGKPGTVTSIEGFEGESQRSCIRVHWQAGNENVYRLGLGNVDLKFTNAANGGVYYPDHLPILGHPSGFEEVTSSDSEFSAGDKVRVNVKSDLLQILQQHHGGWNPQMAQIIGKVGTVLSVTEQGSVRVQYPERVLGWILNPAALTKIQNFSIGDAVRIKDDLARVKSLQERSLCGWNDEMEHCIGQVGMIDDVDKDGDIQIRVNGHVWTFNSLCCESIPPDQQANYRALLPRSGSGNESSRAARNSPEHDLNLFALMMKQIIEETVHVTSPNLSQTSEGIGTKTRGTALLHAASARGDQEMVKHLLKNNMDIDVKDDDGDSCLHLAVFGNQPATMRILLENGANPNAVNDRGQTALHISVNKNLVECSAILLSYNCDVNIQDTSGDTALHDAIGIGDREQTLILCDHRKTVFVVKNKRGCNPLHHAALNGNCFATETILNHDADIVNVVKEDGLTALHLAAHNGHADVARTLVTKGKADTEITNQSSHTPLMHAVVLGHMAVIRVLVEAGANTLATDRDGFSCLHLAVVAYLHSKTEATDFLQRLLLQSTEVSSHKSAQVARYLLEHGADLNQKDKQGRTPLNLAEIDVRFKEFLMQSRKVQSSIECMVCSAADATTTFHPCGHTICCSDCSVRMRKCLKCRSDIEQKTPEGKKVPTCSATQPFRNGSSATKDGADETKILKKKLEEHEESQTCNICMERKRNTAFLCGHCACQQCAAAISECHICRKPITNRINLFT